MKLSNLIAFVLSTAVAMPKIFTKSTGARSTIARRGTGMTSSSIRNYMREQRRRAAARSRLDNILSNYFRVRDSMN